MKILYITPFVQHPLMRSSARHYPFSRELGRRHQITLLTLAKAPVPPEVEAELRGQVEELIIIPALRPPRWSGGGITAPARAIARKVEYWLRRRAALREMSRALRRIVRRTSFDVLLFHGHSVFDVIADFDELPIVVDFCDARSARLRGRMRHASLFTRPLHWLLVQHARRVERRMLEKTPHVAFISRRDRDAILGPASDAVVIPNALDLAYWKRSSPRVPGHGSIVFHGAMDYRPNVDAALQLVRFVLPRVRAVRPDVELLIVGRDPAPELVEAAAGDPNVRLTGEVEDVRPYLEQATAYAAPLRFGAGQQNKLLEAMAMELPVVTTENGAAGLRVTDARPPVVVADPIDVFTAEVLRLLDDERARVALGTAGREYLTAYFSVERGAAVLGRMCNEAVACWKTNVARSSGQRRRPGARHPAIGRTVGHGWTSGVSEGAPSGIGRLSAKRWNQRH